MGCQVSIQHKTLPSTPALKTTSPSSKKSSLRIVYPGSTSESPNNYRSHPSRGQRSDAEFSILRSESRKSIGTIDNIKSDLNLKDKGPLIRIIGIGTPREGNMSEDSVKRGSESSEVSPYNRSPKHNFTFHSGENSMVTMNGDSMFGNSTNKQFSRYLSITPKPSEFFIQKVAGQGGHIVKRGTFGASSSIPADIKSEEEVDAHNSHRKTHVKSMGEIAVEQHSLHAVDQEVMFPDTPAFRSMATNVSTQNHFDNTAENSKVVEPIQRRKDTFGYRGSGGELDLDKVVKKLETEKIKQDKIEKEAKEAKEQQPEMPEIAVLRGRLPNQQPPQVVITEKDETVVSRYSKSSERNSTKTNRTTHTIILHSPDQEQQEDDENVSQNSQRPGGSVYSLISSQITGKNKYKLFLEEKMKKMQVPQPEEAACGQNGMKKVFTTNLLDLLSHRKDSPSPQQVLPEQIRSSIVARRQIKAPTKGSHDFSEESNFLTLSLVSPPKQHFEELKKRGIEGPIVPIPLRFGTLENIRGGEMVSPIGHVKSGSITPISNMTAKQGNVSEIHDERTITNMDNLSRFDFDKYSFVAEVREVEVNQHTSYDESIGAFRSNSRKFTANTQHMRTLESEETYRKITAYLDGKGVARFDTEELAQSNLIESKVFNQK